MTRGTFTVSASDVNGAELLFRIAQVITEKDNIGQVLFKSRTANAAKHRQFGKKIVNSLAVRHPAANVVMWKELLHFEIEFYDPFLNPIGCSDF